MLPNKIAFQMMIMRTSNLPDKSTSSGTFFQLNQRCDGIFDNVAVKSISCVDLIISNVKFLLRGKVPLSHPVVVSQNSCNL